MLWSRVFIPTLRELPAGAPTSHQLLLRAGYVRQAAAGSYSYLLLGRRSLDKIMRIVRQEMDATGAQELRLPAANLETIAATACGALRSYKQLPQIWRQIRTAPPAEDCYSLDLDAAGMHAAHQKLSDAYCRIFARCGITYRSESGGFFAESDAGEDSILSCPACGYAGSLGMAAARPTRPAARDPEGDLTPELLHTPGQKTIADVTAFVGAPESSQIKSLVLVANGSPMLVLLRGDHQLSEAKFAAAVGGAFRPARTEEIRESFGAGAGSLGPVGITRLAILADRALAGRRNMIAGANRDDYHLRHVTPGEDFQAEFLDLRQAEAGDACVNCGAPLEMRKAIELAHLTELGSRPSEAVDLHVTTAEGAETPLAIGSYGIGLDRVLAAAVEQHHDADGICLPAAIAPFSVLVTPVNVRDATLQRAAEEIYRACLALGLDALLDDRDERPGVKFKDADLIGVPWRITVGRKVAEGLVELVERSGRKTMDVPVGEVAERVRERHVN